MTFKLRPEVNATGASQERAFQAEEQLTQRPRAGNELGGPEEHNEGQCSWHQVHKHLLKQKENERAQEKMLGRSSEASCRMSHCLRASGNSLKI